MAVRKFFFHRNILRFGFQQVSNHFYEKQYKGRVELTFFSNVIFF